MCRLLNSASRCMAIACQTGSASWNSAGATDLAQHGLDGLGIVAVQPDHDVGVGAEAGDVVEAADRDAALGGAGDHGVEFGHGVVADAVDRTEGPAEHGPERVGRQQVRVDPGVRVTGLVRVPCGGGRARARARCSWARRNSWIHCPIGCQGRWPPRIRWTALGRSTAVGAPARRYPRPPPRRLRDRPGRAPASRRAPRLNFDAAMPICFGTLSLSSIASRVSNSWARVAATRAARSSCGSVTVPPSVVRLSGLSALRSGRRRPACGCRTASAGSASCRGPSPR